MIDQISVENILVDTKFSFKVLQMNTHTQGQPHSVSKQTLSEGKQKQDPNGTVETNQLPQSLYSLSSHQNFHHTLYHPISVSNRTLRQSQTRIQQDPQWIYYTSSDTDRSQSYTNT